MTPTPAPSETEGPRLSRGPSVRRRSLLYSSVGILLLLGFFVSLRLEWRSGTEQHIALEAVATTLACVAGLFVLATHRASPTGGALFLGIGLLVTGIIEGFHVVAESARLESTWVTPPELRNSWSRDAGRVFLAVVALLAWWVSQHGQKRPASAGSGVAARVLFAVAGASTALILLVLASLPLPRPYSSGLLVGHPQALIPGFLFLLALVLFLRQGEWRRSTFEHAIVVFLLLSVATQVYVAFSQTLFDARFVGAHWLELGSYVAVVLGSLASFRHLSDSEDLRHRELATMHALRESEERFRATFEQAAAGIVHTDLEGRFLRINQRFCDIVGYTREEMLDLTFQEITHPEDLDADLAKVERLLAGAIETYSMEKRYRRKDGTIVWVEITVSLLRAESGEARYFIAVVQDIQRRKEIEARLADSEERYRTIYSTAPVSIWEEDWTGVIEAVRGVDAADGDEFRRHLEEHPEFVAEALRRVKVLDVNDETCELFGAQSKDELLASLETVFATPDTLPGFEGELEALFRGESVYRTEMRLSKVRGGHLDVLLTMSFPPPGSSSGRVLVTLMDLGDRKRAEEIVRRKNRDLETLFYVASHDLREPLRAIETFSQMVRKRYAERLDEKGRDFLHRVVRAAQRMGRLLEDLLVLSRAQRIEAPSTEVDGRDVVRRAVTQLQTGIRERRATVEIAPSFPRLRVDATWASRAVYNLLSNALKFTVEGQTPEIEVVPCEGAGEVGIAVRDRGPGIAPEHRDRIFELFQRAVGREVEGTGAGLAIVRQIAERHGGRVWVQERNGGGSEFVVTFGPSAPPGLEGTVRTDDEAGVAEEETSR